MAQGKNGSESKSSKGAPGAGGEGTEKEKLSPAPSAGEQELSGVPEKKLIPYEEHARISADFEERLLRLQADFENYKKRAEKEKKDEGARAQAKLALELLPILDDFDAALAGAGGNGQKGVRPKEGAGEGMGAKEREGVDMLRHKLLALLKKQGVSEMKVGAGDWFDPHCHEAAESRESELEDGKIASVLTKGYTFEGSVLRHAKVCVSKGKPGKPGE